MRHSWNTGRAYTKHGQRITAQVMGDHVAFVDLDRGIYGSMPLPILPIKTAADLRDHVMNRYDHCKYDSGREAHAFWMLLWEEEKNKTA